MNLPLIADLKESNESGSCIAARGWRTGQVLDGVYRLHECIGHGAMGEIYAAEHLRLGRRLAVKVLRNDQAPKAAQRFRREARAIARVECEYVVNVLDCGELDEETPYLVMELLQGQDLRRLLDTSAPLPVPRAVSLVWEACQGIAAVHDAGLVHRDLKPENLFVSKRATGEDLCKVLDFGVAKQELSNSTVEGALIGTVRYMAPEQLQDGASVSPRSDIYALGAILYECLAGRSPHYGGAVHQLMFKIMNEEPLPLDRLRAEVPAKLAQAVARCLLKAPERRFDNARALAAALAPFARPGAVSLPLRVHDQGCACGRTPFARPGAVSLPLQVDTVDFAERPARLRASLSRSQLLYLGVGLVSGATLSSAPLWHPTAGSSKTPEIVLDSVRPGASVAQVRPPFPSVALSSSATTNASPPDSARLPAPPASTANPVVQATASANRARLATSPVPVVRREFSSPVVLAPNARFDSANPYSPSK